MPIPCIIPIGPWLTALGAWLHSLTEKLKRDSRNPFIKTDTRTIGFADEASLPTPENAAIALADAKIAGREFEAAKHILVSCWTELPRDISSEITYMKLREAFVRLYMAKGTQWRADKIAQMPTMLLDREVQWIVTHPDEQIGGSAVVEPD